MQVHCKMFTLVIGIFFALCSASRGLDLSWEKHQDETETDQPYHILLLGKSEQSKSSLRNHILSREAFSSSHASNSVTKKVQMETGSIGDKPIVVVNTPGGSATSPGRPDTVKILAEAVLRCPEGYNAFLLVFNPNVHITDGEKNDIKRLQIVFGESFFRYVIFVFTHEDVFQKGLFKQYLNELDDDMKTFFSKAGKRYIFLNTEEDSLRERRLTNIKLLQLIEDIGKINGGVRYTNYIFKAATGVGFVGSGLTGNSFPIGSPKEYSGEDSGEGWLSFIIWLICKLLYYTPYPCTEE